EMPYLAVAEARRMKFGPDQRGEPLPAKGRGVDHRKAETLHEMVGEADEVVAAREKAQTRSGDGSPSEREEWQCRLPRRKLPDEVKAASMSAIGRREASLP